MSTVEIIAHRGEWTSPSEHNSADAFRRAWVHGFGVETDLRDLDGLVVVSHDPPRLTSPPPVSLEDLLTWWNDAGRRGRLALNVKADGLAPAVRAAVDAVDAQDRVFVFDMSVPDQSAYLQTDLPVFGRWSEYEPVLRREGVVGTWLDAFGNDSWWVVEDVWSELEAGRAVVLVSPELHGRDPALVWDRVRSAGLSDHPRFGLCTDRPAAAERFFS